MLYLYTQTLDPHLELHVHRIYTIIRMMCEIFVEGTRSSSWRGMDWITSRPLGVVGRVDAPLFVVSNARRDRLVEEEAHTGALMRTGSSCALGGT